MITSFIALSIFIVSLLYRLYGIFSSHPFWVDEFSSATQAKLILENGINLFKNTSIHVEQHNVLVHTLIALSFKIFGLSESSARLPFVLIGSIVPVSVFLLARKIFDIRVGIMAALLTVFSYFQIVWSRQARGYVLLELSILFATYFYVNIMNFKGKDKKILIFNIMGLAISLVIGYFTHALFLVFIFSLFLDICLFHRNLLLYIVKNKAVIIVFSSLLIYAFISGYLKQISDVFTSELLQINNVWYYHSFFWREYGLITFLSLIGIFFSLFLKKTQISLVVIYIVVHLIFINFFFSAYVSRYVLSLFPLLFIFVSYTITFIIDSFLKQKKWSHFKILKVGIPIITTFFIIGNGFKFVATKPKPFYSVNHDFREIALIDYNQVYEVIKKKGKLSEGKTAVIDTWHDRLYWYLGSNYQPAYIFRWINEPGRENGLLRKTIFIYNTHGEKILPKTNDLKLVGELSDLKKALVKYPRGFIFIDDSSLPQDVQDYVKKHFKKELYLDHYPLDDNPYSIWPANLYSWGI